MTLGFLFRFDGPYSELALPVRLSAIDADAAACARGRICGAAFEAAGAPPGGLFEGDGFGKIFSVGLTGALAAAVFFDQRGVRPGVASRRAKRPGGVIAGRRRNLTRSRFHNCHGHMGGESRRGACRIPSSDSPKSNERD